MSINRKLYNNNKSKSKVNMVDNIADFYSYLYLKKLIITHIRYSQHHVINRGKLKTLTIYNIPFLIKENNLFCNDKTSLSKSIQGILKQVNKQNK